MKWLPRERQTPFIAVVIATILVLTGIYFTLISSQYEALEKLSAGKSATDKQLQTYSAAIKNSNANAQQLAEVSTNLLAAETDMASGDLIFWSYNTIRRLQPQYKLNITDTGRPAVSDVDFLPTFPYQQARFSVSGTAYYHDLGKFVADFENQFPHARIVSLSMESPQDGSGEKISFRMQIIVLVKNAS